MASLPHRRLQHIHRRASTKIRVSGGQLLCRADSQLTPHPPRRHCLFSQAVPDCRQRIGAAIPSDTLPTPRPDTIPMPRMRHYLRHQGTTMAIRSAPIGTVPLRVYIRIRFLPHPRCLSTALHSELALSPPDHCHRLHKSRTATSTLRSRMVHTTRMSCSTMS